MGETSGYYSNLQRIRKCRSLFQGADTTASIAALEARVTALEDAVFGGIDVLDETLALWSSSGAYRMQIALENVSGVITSGVLLWPDGSAGTYNVQAINTTWNTADGWQLTHADSGKTITQPTITRSAISGIPVVTPDLIIT